MKIDTSADLVRRSEAESSFYAAVRGIQAPAQLVPLPVRFLANEVSLLGDLFVAQTIEKHAMVDDQGQVLIEFDSLVVALQRFEYICSKEDRNELRTWLYNNGLFVSAPRYYDKHSIFIGLDNLLKALKKDAPETPPEPQINLEVVSHNIRENLVAKQVHKAMEALRLYSR